MSALTTLAEGWPVRTERRDGAAAAAEDGGPPPGDGALAGERWFYVWNRDGLGECCCWRGTVRAGDGTAVKGTCQRPGKHPWITRVDGELYGFVHGAADALDWVDLQDRYGPVGGARQLAVVLEDLLVVDIDGERALRDFARLAYTIPKDKILGVSTTPRGFHVWLDVAGWNQKALNTWLSQWLVSWGWDPTDAKKAGRKGLLLDVRTGANRYVVWPGCNPERRWVGLAEFNGTVQRLRADMPEWRLVGGSAGAKAPWAVDTGDGWLKGWIEEHSGGAGEISLEGLEFQGGESELELTWAELEKWLARLERMAPGAGRNNRLNQVAYFSGTRCIAAGHPVEAVRARLCEVGESVGTHGVAATVNSGLGAGMAALRKQTAAVQAKG